MFVRPAVVDFSGVIFWWQFSGMGNLDNLVRATNKLWYGCHFDARV